MDINIIKFACTSKKKNKSCTKANNILKNILILLNIFNNIVLFQSMGLFQEHNEFIALSTGNIVKFDLMGSYSAELAGQIAFSIWNRNAHSVVESR